MCDNKIKCTRCHNLFHEDQLIDEICESCEDKVKCSDCESYFDKNELNSKGQCDSCHELDNTPTDSECEQCDNDATTNICGVNLCNNCLEHYHY